MLLYFVRPKEELSKADQDVMKCRHHKKHYDEKRSAHLQSIQILQTDIERKEKEVQVCHMAATGSILLYGVVIYLVYPQSHVLNDRSSFTSFVRIYLFPSTLQASVSKATEICPERLEIRRTAKSLDNEINSLKVKIATQQEQQGDRDEIVRYVLPPRVTSWSGDAASRPVTGSECGCCLSHIQTVS